MRCQTPWIAGPRAADCLRVPCVTVFALLALAVSTGCRARNNSGLQCTFSDECVEPLVCAARVCRPQCRSDRDCPGTARCTASPDPSRRVCLPAGTAQSCFNDSDCGATAGCAPDHTCRLRCRAGSDCTGATCGGDGFCSMPLEVLPRDADASVPPDAEVPVDADVTNIDIATPDTLEGSVDAPCVDGGLCDGACRDLSDDPANCGACSTVCPTGVNGTAVCTGGRCSLRCEANFGDCDASPANGCESDLRVDARNCGACAMACPVRAGATTECAAGVCGLRCSGGFGNCDFDDANGCETNTQTSMMHCGRCGVVCSAPSGVTATCTLGACALTCPAGQANCDADSTNGCETDIRTHPQNCGACGTRCPVRSNATPSCASGSCGNSCNPMFGDCDADPANGCETDLQTSVAQCGRCGAACPTRSNSAPACTAGMCRSNCASGFANCDGLDSNGCETRTTADEFNCGGCGAMCPGHVCAAGTCGFAASCRDLHVRQPTYPSGTYRIDSDGAGPNPPFDAPCDMETEGGGWTLVFVQPIDGMNTATQDYTTNDATLIAASSQVLIALRDMSTTTMATCCAETATFPLPASWRTQAPFRYYGTDELLPVTSGGGAPVLRTVRYGHGVWSDAAYNCVGSWLMGSTNRDGRICIQGTRHSAIFGFGLASADACDASDGGTNLCLLTRRYTIGMR